MISLSWGQVAKISERPPVNLPGIASLIFAT